MPFSRSLQHSDGLRHVESTVLWDECVCVLLVKMCSATSLSGKWVVEEKRESEERTEDHKVGYFFFGANNFLWWNSIGSNAINPSPPEAFTRLQDIIFLFCADGDEL